MLAILKIILLINCQRECLVLFLHSANWPEHMWFWASMLLMLESPSVEISMWVCFSWDLKHAPLVFNSFLQRVLITTSFWASILLAWLLWSVLWDCDIKLSSTLVWCYRFGKRFSSFRCAFSCTYCICWEVHRGRWLLGCWDAYFSFCNCGCCTLFLLWWFTPFAAGFHWFLLPLVLACLLRIWCQILDLWFATSLHLKGSVNPCLVL